ncbi:MAG TPA: hypothetical protein DCQ31_15885, partial [Bacteroidales bacterium]|nr:hypothetical protein [Bacteroidales bacterium]
AMESFGIEFESQYQNPQIITVFFNYNFMKGLGNDAKVNFMHIPEHTFKFGANKNFDNFFVSTNSYAVSSVMGNPKLNTPIKSQFMIDVHMGFKHTISANKYIVKHMLSAKNITGSQMLIPEYIRQTDNINSMATAGYGTRIIYTLSISF